MNKILTLLDNLICKHKARILKKNVKLAHATFYWNFINFWNMLICNHGTGYLYEIDQRIPEKRCLACDGNWDSDDPDDWEHLDDEDDDEYMNYGPAGGDWSKF